MEGSFRSEGGIASPGRSRSPVLGSSPPPVSGPMPPAGGFRFGAGAAGMSGEGITRTVNKPLTLAGYSGGLDPRLFPYDVVRTSTDPSAMMWRAGREDRMDVHEAVQKLKELHSALGVSHLSDVQMTAFDNALFFLAATNGTSAMVPGRATFGIPDVTTVFTFDMVRNVLGVDMRRFFRAYADRIIWVVKRVLASVSYGDLESLERAKMVENLSVARGVAKFPWLISDVADSAINLSMEEMAAARHSKTEVLGSGVNTRDRLLAVGKGPTLDRFDPVIRESIS